MNIDKEALKIAIVEKMGYKPCASCLSNGYAGQWRNLEDTGCMTTQQLPNYPDDLNAAWQLVEWMRKEGFGVIFWSVSGGWECQFDGTLKRHAKPEMAICLCFAACNSIPIPQLTT